MLGLLLGGALLGGALEAGALLGAVLPELPGAELLSGGWDGLELPAGGVLLEAGGLLPAGGVELTAEEAAPAWGGRVIRCSTRVSSQVLFPWSRSVPPSWEEVGVLLSSVAGGEETPCQTPQERSPAARMAAMEMAADFFVNFIVTSSGFSFRILRLVEKGDEKNGNRNERRWQCKHSAKAGEDWGHSKVLERVEPAEIHFCSQRAKKLPTIPASAQKAPLEKAVVDGILPVCGRALSRDGGGGRALLASVRCFSRAGEVLGHRRAHIRIQ